MTIFKLAMIKQRFSIDFYFLQEYEAIRRHSFHMPDKYAEKISETRYQFSQGKFLKDCKSKSDLNVKIEFFRQTIRQQLPPFWNEYRNQLLQNSHSVKIA